MKNKPISAAVVILLCATAITPFVHGGWSGGGSGTAADPYQIWTAEQLNRVGLNGHYELRADIDLSVLGENGFNSIGTNRDNHFKGVFEGNGFVISNLSSDVYGLFGYVRGCNTVIRNVRLTNVNLESQRHCVGGIVGDLWGGTVSGCYVQGNVEGGGIVGGVVGDAHAYAVVFDCHSECTVSGHTRCGGVMGRNMAMMADCSSNSIISAVYEGGGLVGCNGGIITRSNSLGTVDSGEISGGIVGYNSGTVVNCYSMSQVAGEYMVGGIAGLISHDGAIFKCYSLGQIAEEKSHPGGLVGKIQGTEVMVEDSFWSSINGEIASPFPYGYYLEEAYLSIVDCYQVTLPEMRSKEMFLERGWDFTGETLNGTAEIWSIDEGESSPYLPSKTTYYVDGANGDDAKGGLSSDDAFASIGSAIDKAISGDTIIVAEGTYFENITFGGKNIVLRSVDPEVMSVREETIIDGGASGSVVIFEGSEDASCQLSGFTIRGGKAGYGGGIAGNGCTANIFGCIVENNQADGPGGGIHNCDGLISNCVVRGNKSISGGGLGGCDGWINNCLIARNEADYGGGIRNCDGLINNSTIADNTAIEGGATIHCDGSIANCIIWDNSEPENVANNAQIEYSCYKGGTGWNIDEDPLFIDAENGNYHLTLNSPCIDIAKSPFRYDDITCNARPVIINIRYTRYDQTKGADLGAYERTITRPVANAGDDTEVYASWNGTAKVTLDGSGSYDDDGDILTYHWTKYQPPTIRKVPLGDLQENESSMQHLVDMQSLSTELSRGELLDLRSKIKLPPFMGLPNHEDFATGVNPTIELPVGEHVIRLVVSDGRESSSDEVVINVIQAIETDIRFSPRIINPKSNGWGFVAVMHLPEDTNGDVIDAGYGIVLQPDRIEARLWRVSGNADKQTLFAIFDRQKVIDALETGDQNQIHIVCRMVSGQYLHGSDTIKIAGQADKTRQPFNFNRQGKSQRRKR